MTTAVSSTTPIAAPTTSAGAGATGNSSLANKDDFLKLFIAQLKNQDPLSPQDNSAFVAQLAQFAQLEQTTQTNTNLTSISQAEQFSQRSSLSQMVGKTVTSQTGSITIDPLKGNLNGLSVHLDAPSASSTLTITSSDGSQVIRTIKLGPQTVAGDFTASWDGLGADGKPVPAGSYAITATSVAKDGSKLAAVPEVRGVVTSIQFLGATPQLRIGGALITPGDISSIDQ